MQLGTAASKGTDDHNNPAITILPDGRLLVSYSRHSKDNHFFTRTSKVANPDSDSDWNTEQTVSTNEKNSYVNTYRLSAESDEIYVFHRDINWNPTITRSSDNNMRPIVPENHGRTRHVLWFNGTYSSFSTKVLGVFDDEKEEFTAWQTGFDIDGAALTDDSDGDGLVDLLEYALGSDPTDPQDHPFPTISSDRFSFHHLPPRTDVEWIVETAPDLLGAWTTVATVRAAGLPNDIADGYALGTDGGDPTLLTLAPTEASPREFYRLKVRYGN